MKEASTITSESPSAMPRNTRIGRYSRSRTSIRGALPEASSAEVDRFGTEYATKQETSRTGTPKQSGCASAAAADTGGATKGNRSRHCRFGDATQAVKLLRPEDGGSDGARTRDLRRDRPAL